MALNTERIIEELRGEIRTLESAVATLLEYQGRRSGAVPPEDEDEPTNPPRGRPPMTEEQKRAQSRRMKALWRKKKKAELATL